MDHQEVGFGNIVWIDLVQYSNRRRLLVNSVGNLQVSLNAGNFLIS
jgi:hypothetical protein